MLSSYQELKKANPTFPILVRECSGVEAKLIARYGERHTGVPLLLLWRGGKEAPPAGGLLCGRLRDALTRGSRQAAGAQCGRRARAALLPCEPARRSSAARSQPPKPPLAWRSARPSNQPLNPCADFGVEEAVKVEGLSKADVAKQLEALVKKGETMPRSAESEGAL